MLLAAALPVSASLWVLSQPWWEFAIRAVIVYGFILLIFRFTGKRQVGQLTPFDLVLLLVISNAVQNSMNAGDNTVSAGLILVIALVGIHWLVGQVVFRSKRGELLLEGKPQLLVHDGRADEKILAAEQLTHHELMAAVRKAGYASLEEVRFAVLETNGTISIIGRKDHSSGASPR